MGGRNAFVNTLKNSIMANNLIFSGPKANKDQASVGFGDTYSEDNVVFDYNIVCGPQKLIGFLSNGVSVFYRNAETLNAGTRYKHNTSATHH